MSGTAVAVRHVPVMVLEVTEALAPADGEVFVDATFGAGGYAQALMDAAHCRVIGIDRDPVAVALGADVAARYQCRLQVVQGRFADMEALLAARSLVAVNGVAFDLGVSSPQLEDPARGFSFSHDGPLDMRMGQDGPSAADFVNAASEAVLADIIARYGEERRARAVARAIVRARSEAPIERTGRLAEIVARVVRRGADGIHPATRTFQALRIQVNDEFGELARGLAAAERLLAPGGRLAVVSFHSLEDRLVKGFLRARAGLAPRGSRHLPSAEGEPRPPSFQLAARGVRKPGAAEIAANPRARSARLRAAVRTAAQAWPAEAAA